MTEERVTERFVVVDAEQERAPGPVRRERPAEELGVDGVVDARRPPRECRVPDALPDDVPGVAEGVGEVGCVVSRREWVEFGADHEDSRSISTRWTGVNGCAFRGMSSQNDEPVTHGPRSAQ